MKINHEAILDEIEKFDFETGTISSLLTLCTKVETEQEAQRVIERYKAVNEFAEKNLGYIFGYCGEETRKKLYKLFPLSHPIFGPTFGRE